MHIESEAAIGNAPPEAGRQFMDGLPDDRHLTEQLLRMRTQDFTGGGERKTPRATLEQTSTKRVLQRSDARADGGLANAQGCGGAVKAAIGGNGKKCLELYDFHGQLRTAKSSVPERTDNYFSITMIITIRLTDHTIFPTIAFL